MAGHRAERATDHLKAEAGLILNGGISSTAVADQLRSSRSISDAIDRMAQDAASSPEAQDLTTHYRSSLLHALGQNGVLDDFSCGLSLCAGVVRARSNADHEAWGRRLAAEASSPTYSYVEVSENISVGYENRFIFSTDPALDSISGD